MLFSNGSGDCHARLGNMWSALSAGTEPAGYVHPKALAVLPEIGIHHQGRSKLADEFRNTDFDLVVTVCNSAAEDYPVWIEMGRRAHHRFLDPAVPRGQRRKLRMYFVLCGMRSKKRLFQFYKCILKNLFNKANFGLAGCHLYWKTS